MLVLSRKTNEQLCLARGDATILVTVLQVSAGRVKLGIVAPRDIRIERADTSRRQSRGTSRECS